MGRAAVGIGFRSFIFGEDGSLWRLPEQLSSALATGRLRLPELANQTWRVASVVLETEGGKPASVIRVSGTLWHFDERGGAQRNLARGAIEALGMHRESREEAASAGGTVVDISGQLRRRRWWAEHRWEPTPGRDHADDQRHLAQGGRPPGRAAQINQNELETEETGVTSCGVGSRWCREHVYTIQRELRDLSEPDLNGVMTKLNEEGANEVIDACLWGGVAEACKQEIERRKAWRRRKGRWYAVAERIEWQGHERAVGRGEPLEHVATDSKDAAEVAARELIRKYADLFTERTAVRVDIHPEIEWQPPED